MQIVLQYLHNFLRIVLLPTRILLLLILNNNAYHTAIAAITLNQGWNWIGYVPTVTLPLGQALQNLQAEENDLIKGLDSFAIYDARSASASFIIWSH